MIIRTISQLPETTEDLQNDTLFEVSIPRDGQYISKKVKFEKVNRQIADSQESELVKKYELTDPNGDPISLNEVKTTTDDLHLGNCTVAGTKTIEGSIQLPHVNYNSGTDYSKSTTAVNARFVYGAMSDVPTFIDGNKIATNAIGADGSIYGSTSSFLKMNFAERSSTGIYTSTEAICGKSGSLVAYGWLADTGNVDPAAAWVALEGYVKINSTTSKWIILQLQPWILGERHQNIQYVGFNVQVHSNLKIRISTGFELDYQNSSFQGRKNSLVKNVNTAGTNITNAFIGYVL